MNRKYGWPAALTIFTLLVLGIVLTDWQSPIRPFLVFLFLLYCPGIAYVKLLRIDTWLIELTIGVALSLALGQLVSMSVLYLGVWSLRLNMLALSAVCLLGAGLQWRQLNKR